MENQDQKSSPQAPTEMPPHGIKGLVSDRPPMSVARAAEYVVILALLMAVIMGIIYLWQTFRKRRKAKVVVTPPANPWTVLRDRVAGLVVPVDGSETQWNQFASELSLCLRLAVEYVTTKPVTDCTTEEITRMVRHGEITVSPVSMDDVLSTLQSLDAVRFGGRIPLREQGQDLLSKIKQWVSDLDRSKTEVGRVVD